MADDPPELPNVGGSGGVGGLHGPRKGHVHRRRLIARGLLIARRRLLIARARQPTQPENNDDDDGGLGAHNFCRAVGKRGATGPWCFTLAPKRPEWDYCDVGPQMLHCDTYASVSEI
ncbi:hypothetical protein T492DRAFT_44324 [Pavlovales sp. CCMP2436]|nr:hypothetical protein T492DRAFT_44324 [Pavlovales sp. CCMP2436]